MNRVWWVALFFLFCDELVSCVVLAVLMVAFFVWLAKNVLKGEKKNVRD